MTDTNDPFPTFEPGTPLPVILRTLAGWFENNPHMTADAIDIRQHTDLGDSVLTKAEARGYLEAFAERFGGPIHEATNSDYTEAGSISSGPNAAVRYTVFGPKRERPDTGKE